MVCNEIVDIIGICGFSVTANLMVRTETEIGKKLETNLNQNCKRNGGEYLPVVLVLCNRIRNLWSQRT